MLSDRIAKQERLIEWLNCQVRAESKKLQKLYTERHRRDMERLKRDKSN